MADRHPARSQLLLTQSDFQRVYQSRDLYFLTQSGDTLVPDPVFVPQQATNTELATGLVQALLQDPRRMAGRCRVDRVPCDSYRIGQVRINGPSATVDLGGKAEYRQSGSGSSRWPPSSSGRWTAVPSSRF